MKTIHLLFWLIVISITSGYAQIQIPQIINATGGSYQKDGYSVNWSIGELGLANQMNASDGSYLCTNGLIQPEKINLFPATKIEFNSDKIRIFPNPTHDMVEIDLFQNIVGKVTIQLTDITGHIQYTHEIFSYGFGFVEKINMKALANGTYTLQIKRLNPNPGQFNIESGAYKIIKL